MDYCLEWLQCRLNTVEYYGAALSENEFYKDSDGYKASDKGF